jgi:hypothetical protein
MLVGDTVDLPSALTDQGATGALGKERPETVARWLDAAIASGLVGVSSDRYRALSLTPRGRAVKSGRMEPLDMTASRRASRATSRRRFDAHGDLFRHEARFLHRRQWRRY